MSRPAPEPAAVCEQDAPDGRSTRWDDHNAGRRARILDAAIELVQQAGGDVAVRDISARARVPRSVVYRIFRDRDDLDEQVRAEIVARLMRVLSPALEPHGTIRETINTAATTYVQWVSDNPLLHQFLGTGSARRGTTGSRVVSGTRTAIARRVQAMIEAAGARTGAHAALAEPLAFALVGLVDGSVNVWVNHAGARVTSRTLSEFLADSIWAMLAAHGPSLGFALTPDTPASEVLGQV